MPEQQYIETQTPALPYPPDMTGKADLLDKINPDKVVEQIKQRLMGREFDKNTRRWVENPSLVTEAVSELCANDMAILVLSVSNQNTSISKLNDKEIKIRALSIMGTAIDMMLAKWNEYEITNSSQISYVAEIVFSLCFITMKQADAEGIRKMIVGSRQEMHHIAEAPRPERRGIFGRRKW